MLEYDKIAKQFKKYKRSKDSMLRCIFDPSLFKFAGNVKNKSVLDAGCGEGYYTRIFKDLGASEVVGVDVSAEMIRLARTEEKDNPRGIKYFIYDVAKMPKLGEFDIVAGTLILHYSKTKKELENMCRNIYKNLKKEGVLVALNNNPAHPLRTRKGFNWTITAKKPIKEGSELKVTLYGKNKETLSFSNYFWSKKTYKEALLKAGFRKCRWQKCITSNAGIKKFGKGAWNSFKRNPTIAILECYK